MVGGDALAAEAEAALTEAVETSQSAKTCLVTPTGETTEAATTGDGFAYQAAPIPDNALVTGWNEKRLVELEKAYSNPRDQVKRLQTLLELPNLGDADLEVIVDGNSPLFFGMQRTQRGLFRLEADTLTLVHGIGVDHVVRVSHRRRIGRSLPCSTYTARLPRCS